MTLRTTRKTVTFVRPFVLKGLDAEQPAGTYVVETAEELLDTMLLPAYRRTSTTIELHPRPGNRAVTEMATIDPNDLDAALARDAVRPTASRADGSETLTQARARKHS